MIHIPFPAPVTAALAVLRARIVTALFVLRARPEAGYSSEATVVTSLLVGAAAVVFGTIFWPDMVSVAKSVFSDITHP